MRGLRRARVAYAPGMAHDGFVLVHGGYHGAWCWDAVRPLLSGASIAVDLPGRGTRPLDARPVTVDRCVDAVIEDADAAGMERFVLVGHSMGGITITETANRHPDRVVHLVYLAALVLEPGRCTFDLYFPDGAPPLEDPAGVQPLMDEERAHQMFCADLDAEQFRDAHARCVPEPLGLFAAAVSGYDSGVTATYIRCSRDQPVPPAMVDAVLPILRPSAVIELDSDHDVMLSHPQALADVLNGIAAIA